MNNSFITFIELIKKVAGVLYDSILNARVE